MKKDKILNSFKDKGLDPEQILAFVNNTSNIQEILDKINELERKNLNREEIYKRICLQVNQNQINKELEKIKKKHEDEKKGLLKIITQKLMFKIQFLIIIFKIQFLIIIYKIQLHKLLFKIIMQTLIYPIFLKVILKNQDMTLKLKDLII